MDNNKNTEMEFDLEDILNEFHDYSKDEPVPQEQKPEPEVTGQMPALEPELEATRRMPELTFAPAEQETGEEAEPQIPAEPALTIRFDPVGEAAAEPERSDGEQESEAASVPEGDTQGFTLNAEESAPADETGKAEPETPEAPPVVPEPRSRLRELKKKLVSGPEKRYYELEDQGLGRLQLAILVNLLLVVGSAAIAFLFTTEALGENRLRMVIFTQVLAMMISGLTCCNLMLDSLGELFKGKLTLNTLLTVTFAACFADGILCLQELRIPCCAAFSLEAMMALWARYHRYTTEMAQMDTMRKAVRLHGIVKVSDFYKGKPGLLRTEAEVEDFMDHYQKLAGPELGQSIYAGLSLLACMAVAIFAGFFQGVSMGVQIFATSLLVAIPASFFVSVTRPMALLENRLHMVGSVLCGWKGIKSLCGKAAFPLTDTDLFPKGASKLNGVKFYSDRDPDEVVVYSTSLIQNTGSGLVPVFQQLLAGRNGSVLKVENFRNYENGGIGGEIRGESVLLGSMNFLQDMGVEIPEGTMVSQAVYAAIDGQLCAVYAMAYAKMRSAAAGLVSLCGYRKLTPVVLCGDFTLTEDFLRAKFNIKTRRMVFPTRDERAVLAGIEPAPDCRVLGISTREELVSAAYLVTGARAVRQSAKIGMIIHVIGGVIGLLIMAALAVLGNTELLTPINILLYQLVWAIPGLLVTEWTRIV